MNDDWKCLGCHCTFDGGCEYERETAIALKNRERLVIPPKKLVVPPGFSRTSTLNREEVNRKARESYRNRIESRGGTVRARK